MARRQLEAAVSALTKAGWRARGVVRAGQPLPELLAAIRAERADLLALGARGAGAVRHFLLGSVVARPSRCWWFADRVIASGGRPSGAVAD